MNIIRKSFYALGALAAIASSTTVNAAYYPNMGDLYYDGQYYMDSWFVWSSPGPWSVESPGYEHDLHVHDTNFFASTCISATTMPDGYDDCPTAGVLDPDGPVFSFGTFNANSLAANAAYWGGWQWTSHGSASTSPFTLFGQENENVCLGIPTIWCMYSTQTERLISGWYMNWLGAPTILAW